LIERVLNIFFTNPEVTGNGDKVGLWNSFYGENTRRN